MGDEITAHLAWLAWTGHAPSTIEARHRALRRLARALPVPLLDATPGHLAAWRAGLTVTPNTVVGYASHAREFYAWAVRSGLLSSNPADGLPVPRLTRGLPRPISEQALTDAVASAPPRIRPWLVLAGWAGLRAKEIALLRRERVLDTATPPVLLIAADATKGHRERIVPMSGFVLTELRIAGLFPRRDGGGGPNAPHTISHLAAAHLHSCGTPATLHSLRHRFGTILYQQTKDLRLVQELMGHARPETTAGYTAFDRVSAVAAVESLPTPRRLAAVEDAG
jgi:integrase/recombinase XerC